MPFRLEGGRYVAAFAQQEVEVLRELIDQMTAMLNPLAPASPDELGMNGSHAASDDPALRRLFPDAYRDDPDASSEYRRLTEQTLALRKVTNASLLRATLGDGLAELDAPQAEAWLTVLTDLRLIIAVRLGIETADDVGHDDEVMQDIYQWLGFVQGSLLDAMEG
ncbi:hypothetical protein M2152_001480 [Microbacteriaceae bacterium SG_E_30_P1]|uniref:DUF2017 domain-containing protein n=1 Tax=Antiquaquibacter oligotrophicus TaxID=2880260 RepID=A0ABT6KPA4_9MICO|nr:DUF2017 domain-containing protein [Antiquaquibacter oligotrophicus]MDH6181298.1 hypothetical protein [Antiquaquibacter oligotrophicus]UDF13009.1 DUF2017 domain-containing protein [Antiquaquibacter oligotrophicus]